MTAGSNYTSGNGAGSHPADAEASSAGSASSVLRVPDWDEDAEAALVSCVIGNRVRMIDLDGMPPPSDFYDGLHRSVYAAAIEVIAEKGRHDPRFLAARLRRDGIVPSTDYWADVRARAAQPEFVGEYAEIVRSLAMRRRVRDLGHTLIQAASSGIADRSELLAIVDRSVESVYSANGSPDQSGELVPLQDAVEAACKRLRNPDDTVRRRTVRFGINGMDEATGGVAPGNICTIAAAPGGGKTSLTLGVILWSAANQGIRWLIVSKEMTPVQLAEQMLFMRSGIDGKKLRVTGTLTKEEWLRFDAARDELLALHAKDGTPHVVIVPPRGMSARSVASMIRREHAVRGLGAFAVDYLQILDWPEEEIETGRGAGARRRRQRTADTLEARIAEDAQMFKTLAQQCDCAGFLLSQYNRGDQRHGSKSDPAPTLASLKGSGGIAAASDLVCALHCGLSPEEQAAETKDGRALPVNAHFLKGRFTGQSVVSLDFETRFTRFVDRGSAMDSDSAAGFAEADRLKREGSTAPRTYTGDSTWSNGDDDNG